MRQKLKSEALLAELLRSGAFMLRALYKDLYDSDLPHPNEVHGTIITHYPELEVRKDTRRYLEFVANRFGVNPQPKGGLFVEGETEVKAISRFKAILRLIDFLHFRQTFAFVILDNESDASKFNSATKKEKSVFFPNRRITRREYVKVWKSCFELDNFSDTEIANAMTEVCGGAVTFARRDIKNCRTDTNPGNALSTLYLEKTGHDLVKPQLGVSLTSNMLKSASMKSIERRPIIQFLSRMHHLVALNPLPVRQENWAINQQTKFFGTRATRAKLGTADRRKGRAAS